MFFRAKDPASLARWYEEHLGINPVPDSYEAACWSQEAGARRSLPLSARTRTISDVPSSNG